MKREGFCTACQQVLPRIMKGDFVLHSDGFIGVVCSVGKARYASVTILSGPYRGHMGLWEQETCRVVHGYLHIDRRTC